MRRTVVFGAAFVLAMCVVGRTARATPETYDFAAYVLGSKVLDPTVPLPGFLEPCNCDPFIGPGFSGTLVVDLALPPEQRLLALHVETTYDDNTTSRQDLDVVPGHPDNAVVSLTSSQLAGNVPPPQWEIVRATGRTGPLLAQAGRSIGISLQWSGEPGSPRQYPLDASDVNFATLTPRTSWRMTFTLSDASAVYATSYANLTVLHRRGTGGPDYRETFSDGSAPGWTPQGSGQWSAVTGDLRNATNTSFTSNTIDGIELPNQFVLLADVYLSWGASGNTAGLLLNYHGPGDFYELRLNARGMWRLDEVRGGVRRGRFAGASFPNAGTRRWHSIYVKRTGFRGEEFEIHINGERVLSDLIDPFERPFPIVGGTVGVFASWNLARFDNVMIGAPIGRGPQGMQAFDSCCGNPPNFTGHSGTWTIENGYMRSSANQAASIATLNNWDIIFKDRLSPPVYGISGRIYLEWSGAGNWGGFMYDYIDARNYREVRVSRSVPARLGEIVLAETVNGVRREVFRAPRLQSSTDREVWLTLTRENDRTIVHELSTVSNIQVRQAPPTVPTLSGLGLFAAWNQVRFDDVVIFSAAREIEASTQITITPTDMTGLRSLGSIFVLSFDAVKKADNLEDRTVAHFHVSGLPEVLPNATLNIPTNNIDPGVPGGIFEVYSFVGDGIVSTDEWNAGTLFHAFAGLPGEHLTLSVDITELLQSAVENGDLYLSFNFRAGNSDRYWLSNIVGLPEPSITIVLPSSRHDCMKEGWKSFGFENQGQCTQFVDTGK